jgi:uncharacterized protein YndB with AHSA1/START domain
VRFDRNLLSSLDWNMNTKPNITSSVPAGLQIVNTRIFAAPREIVFAAFENPDALAQWWGPDGFTNTIKEFDLRPGGAWRYIMHGPNGTDYDNESVFVEIVKPEKIVFEHLRPMHWYHMTMTYVEAPEGKSRFTWRMVFKRTPENEKLQIFISEANEQNFDRLAAYLEKTKRR